MTFFHSDTNTGIFSRDDFWKLVSLIIMIAAGLSAHGDRLPAPLVPYTGWIEFVSYVGTIIQAWRLQQPQGPKG